MLPKEEKEKTISEEGNIYYNERNIYEEGKKWQDLHYREIFIMEQARWQS